jgi:hypothetical protein
MRKTLLFVVLSFIGSVANNASAQVPVAAPVAGPIHNWTYYRHSSTAEEGILRGQAAAVEAMGQANYANSLAAVNYADAYRRQLENSRLYVQTALENRERILSFRERYSPTPLSREVWEQLSQKGLPARLTPDQFDNGQLVWPHILRMDQYTPLRERIDTLVAMRDPDNSGDGSPMQRELHSLVEAMKMLLKDNIDTVTPSQYGHAKSFLTSLNYEMRHPLHAQVPVQEPAAVGEPEALQAVN